MRPEIGWFLGRLKNFFWNTFPPGLQRPTSDQEASYKNITRWHPCLFYTYIAGIQKLSQSPEWGYFFSGQVSNSCHVNTVEQGYHFIAQVQRDSWSNPFLKTKKRMFSVLRHFNSSQKWNEPNERERKKGGGGGRRILRRRRRRQWNRECTYLVPSK